jgi:hypothetical protein
VNKRGYDSQLPTIKAPIKAILQDQLGCMVISMYIRVTSKQIRMRSVSRETIWSCVKNIIKTTRNKPRHATHTGNMEV